jgi:hypothetical protein
VLRVVEPGVHPLKPSVTLDVNAVPTRTARP